MHAGLRVLPMRRVRRRGGGQDRRNEVLQQTLASHRRALTALADYAALVACAGSIGRVDQSYARRPSPWALPATSFTTLLVWYPFVYIELTEPVRWSVLSTIFDPPGM